MDQPLAQDQLREFHPTDAAPCFYDDAGRTAARSTDLISLGPPLPDPRAIFSVLQFGAVVPPLSPWQGIHRFVSGYRYQGTRQLGPVTLDPPAKLAPLDRAERITTFNHVMDGALRRFVGDGSHPVLLFSGGVDSGYLASRLKALGYSDTLLLNYSFGPDDEESQLAEEMAGKFGFRFERVEITRTPTACFADPGQVFLLPFGDQSTSPTSNLAHAVLTRLNGEKRPIIDGTGADGAFGMNALVEQWQKVMRIPAFARRLLSANYGNSLWLQVNRREYITRVLLRSVSMPLMAAVLAQNPLAGILYDDAPGKEVHALFEHWINGWTAPNITQRVIAGDLAMICANIYCQKARQMYVNAGLPFCLPFLEPDIVALTLDSFDQWDDAESKWLLKASLAQDVPAEMVYRQKSGFTSPPERLFLEPEFVAYLRAAADDDSPLAGLVDARRIRQAADRLHGGQVLPDQTLSCLWSITFTDRWYRTATV